MRVRAVLLAAIALLAASASIPAGPAHAEVRIGAAGPITGNNDWYRRADAARRRGRRRGPERARRRAGPTGAGRAGDDACDAEQGVAAARKLVADGVVFVSGHVCSGAAIPASAVYEAHDVLDIAPTATNPRLTEQGFTRIFRLVGRDDQQGEFAAGFITDQVARQAGRARARRSRRTGRAWSSR